MITAEQMRAARALLKWSAQELANRVGMNWRTIQRLESEKGFPASRLEDAGVVFIDQNGGGPGVRLKEPLPD
jgi:predicted transcriptional regulator